MSMVSIPKIDNELKHDFFNCYKFENSTKIQSDNPQFPQSIIGVRNYNKDIETFWENYKKYIMDKYYDFQIISCTMNYTEQFMQNDKFSVVFELTNPSNTYSVYVLSYYNANNINIEFYPSIESVYLQENWKVEKYIGKLPILLQLFQLYFVKKQEIYRQYNADDLDVRLNIKQIITIADKYIIRFYHQSTNNDRHYAEEFLQIYKEYKDEMSKKDYLY